MCCTSCFYLTPLYKNAAISSLQIALIVALKPMPSLLSPYWSQAICQRPNRIVSNLAGAHFLRYLPFLHSRGLMLLGTLFCLTASFQFIVTPRRTTEQKA
ncbi:MAG: hypothetical protein ACKVOH_03565 [Chlamydiales bacterium]